MLRILAGLYCQFDGSTYFPVDFYIHKFWYTDDDNPVLRKISFGQYQRFYRLIYRASADSLNDRVLVFAHHPRNRPCDGSCS